MQTTCISEALQEYGADIRRLVKLACPEASEKDFHQRSLQRFIAGVVETK